jgi:hypothetical protein
VRARRLGGEDAADLAVSRCITRSDEPRQERRAAVSRRDRVAPGLADGVQADVVGGDVEAVGDVQEVRPRRRPAETRGRHGT